MTKFYTDGACWGNGRGAGSVGGWGFCWQEADGHFIGHSGGLLDTTNNIMELTAALEALRHGLAVNLAVKQGQATPDCLFKEITIVSVSPYVVNGLTKWLPDWKRKGWKTAGGSPVRNRNLWETLESVVNALAAAGCPVTWEWVRGPADYPGNEMADKLAHEGADKALAAAAPAAAPRIVGGVNVSEWHFNGSSGDYLDFEREVIAFDDEGNSSVDLRLTFNAADRTAYMVLLRRNNDGNTRELGDEIKMTWAHARTLICHRPDLLARLPFEDDAPDMSKPFEALLMGVPEHLSKEPWVRDACKAMNALREAAGQ